MNETWEGQAGMVKITKLERLERELRHLKLVECQLVNEHQLEEDRLAILEEEERNEPAHEKSTNQRQEVAEVTKWVLDRCEMPKQQTDFFTTDRVAEDNLDTTDLRKMYGEGLYPQDSARAYISSENYWSIGEDAALRKAVFVGCARKREEETLEKERLAREELRDDPENFKRPSMPQWVELYTSGIMESFTMDDWEEIANYYNHNKPPHTLQRGAVNCITQWHTSASLMIPDYAPEAIRAVVTTVPSEDVNAGNLLAECRQDGITRIGAAPCLLYVPSITCLDLLKMDKEDKQYLRVLLGKYGPSNTVFLKSKMGEKYPKWRNAPIALFENYVTKETKYTGGVAEEQSKKVTHAQLVAALHDTCAAAKMFPKLPREWHAQLCGTTAYAEIGKYNKQQLPSIKNSCLIKAGMYEAPPLPVQSASLGKRTAAVLKASYFTPRKRARTDVGCSLWMSNVGMLPSAQACSASQASFDSLMMALCGKVPSDLGFIDAYNAAAEQDMKTVTSSEELNSKLEKAASHPMTVVFSAAAVAAFEGLLVSGAVHCREHKII